MREQKSKGSIVFIASISGHRVNYPQPQVAYNVSKSSLLHLKNCLAAEWARYGIRVNTISPGYMDTILNEGAGLERARNSWASRNPMGRMGLPEELTGPLILLTSHAGSYINGADILVDGKWSAVHMTSLADSRTRRRRGVLEGTVDRRVVYTDNRGVVLLFPWQKQSGSWLHKSLGGTATAVVGAVVDVWFRLLLWSLF